VTPTTHPTVRIAACLAGVALLLATARAAPPEERPPPAPPGAAPAPADLARRLDRDVRPILARRCFECHGGGEAEGGVALDRFPDLESVTSERQLWRRVSQALRDEAMPPDDRPAPSAAERAAVVAWIDDALASDCGAGPQDPGRTTVRRLNRFEYDRTLTDLLGVEVRAAERFPEDDRGHGFDNNADVLTISPLLVEKLLQAAEKALASAVVLGDPLAKKVERAEPSYLDATSGASPKGSSPRGLYSNGALLWPRTILCEAEYVIRVRASGDQAGPDLPRLSVRVDDAEVASFEVDAVRGKAKVYERRVRLAAGARRLAFAFTNDYYRQGAGPDGANLDRNLHVEQVELEGPFGATASSLPEPHRRIFFVMPEKKIPELEAARRITARFAARAFRRPVSDDEATRYLGLFKAARARKEPFVASVVPALTAVLVSPHFLYRVEREPQGLTRGAAYDVPPFELASRLSYFLWSSMPDAALTAAATEGRLATATSVEAEARRMLQDPRADALVHGFASQWLELPNLAAAEPDRARFPDFDAALKASMRRETERFLEGIIREDRSILELIESDYLWVDGALARHYGIEGVDGPEWRKVPSSGTGRGGVLGHASLLTLTSRPTRTSPVLRGRWLLDAVLGAPPRPAPPGVPPLEEATAGDAPRTLRDRMARHRKDPACISCHERMDPLGFALEEFDAVGARRERDGVLPVDARGELPDGTAIQGLPGLKRYLLERKADFARAFARRLLTWALGRGVEADGPDGCAVDEVARRIEAGGYRWSEAVTAVVSSEPFRRKRAEGKRSEGKR